MDRVSKNEAFEKKKILPANDRQDNTGGRFI